MEEKPIIMVKGFLIPYDITLTNSRDLNKKNNVLKHIARKLTLFCASIRATVTLCCSVFLKALYILSNW